MSRTGIRKKPRRVLVAGGGLIVFIFVSVMAALWLGARADTIRSSLVQASDLAPVLKQQILEKNHGAAERTALGMSVHTQTATSAADDPVWKAARTLPWIGNNFSAVSEMAQSADDVMRGAIAPLVRVAEDIDSNSFAPTRGRFDLRPLKNNSSVLQSASHTIDLTHARLAQIDSASLQPAVAQPLARVKQLLGEIEGPVGMVADAALLLPKMLGDEQPRNYLVLIQNNAEVRSTGGLAGALAVVKADKGLLSLTEQSSGAALGRFVPPVQVPDEQRVIYSNRLGSFIGDVNLTPDFPTVGRTAKEMWETRFRTRIAGVIALDPVVLSHLLAATGPISIAESPLAPDLPGVPDRLNAGNIVQKLLSQTYAATDEDHVQDEYFAAVSQQVFKKLTTSKLEAPGLLDALNTSVQENRLHAWSASPAEQEVLGRTALGGAISGPSVSGAAFGAFFNDGTGAKMDYHVSRTVQLVRRCGDAGYSDYTVRVELKNNAPMDAASALPKAVTGGGKFGTKPGWVQTNVVVYGPSQSHVKSVVRDGQKIGFGSYAHAGRPVGVATSKLAPGQIAQFEVNFVQVVQDENPSLVVTPTVQPVSDVTLPTRVEECSSQVRTK